MSSWPCLERGVSVVGVHCSRLLFQMHYVSSIKHESLNLDHSSDGHKLRCEARVGDLEELSLNVERTMNLLCKCFLQCKCDRDRSLISL